MRSELFKTALQNYKDEWAKCLHEGGEGKRVAAFLEKIDHQIPLSQHMFDVAWQHRQTEVEGLQKENKNLQSLIKGHELRQKLNLSIKKNLRNKNQEPLERIEAYEELMQGLLDQRLNLDDLEQALKGGSDHE